MSKEADEDMEYFRTKLRRSLGIKEKSMHIPPDRVKNPPLASPIVVDHATMVGMVGGDVAAMIERSTVREDEKKCENCGDTNMVFNHKGEWLCNACDMKRTSDPTAWRERKRKTEDANVVKDAAAEAHKCSQCGKPNYQWILGDPCMKCVRANHARAVGRTPDKSVPLRRVKENAKGVTYHTCPECEANFKSTDMKDGKFPPHRAFNGQGQCPGTGIGENMEDFQAKIDAKLKEAVPNGKSNEYTDRLDAVKKNVMAVVNSLKGGEHDAAYDYASRLLNHKPADVEGLSIEIKRKLYAAYYDASRNTGAITPASARRVEAFVLYRDGKEITRGTEQAIWEYIHDNHSFSVDHAIKYEGFSIKKEAALKVNRSDILKSKDSSPSADSECDEGFQAEIEKKLRQAE